jgi:hypothetical protein
MNLVSLFVRIPKQDESCDPQNITSIYVIDDHATNVFSHPHNYVETALSQVNKDVNGKADILAASNIKVCGNNVLFITIFRYGDTPIRPATSSLIFPYID